MNTLVKVAHELTLVIAIWCAFAASIVVLGLPPMYQTTLVRVNGVILEPTSTVQGSVTATEAQGPSPGPSFIASSYEEPDLREERYHDRE